MISDGVTAPILVDEDGVIIYGHGRRLAALQNGFEEYPVLIARGWDEQKKRAYRIKDNSYQDLSAFDSELMRIEIGMLKTEGYELALLGFGESQLVQFTTTPGPPDAFKAVGEDIETSYCCPRCKYSWSGSPKPAGEEDSGKSAKAKKKK